MILKRFRRRREFRPRIKSPLEVRLAGLVDYRKEVRAMAEEIIAQETISAQDRNRFSELLELNDEIKYFARRLTTPGEKWKVPYGEKKLAFKD